MALDPSLSELLTEYKNLAESDQENHNFLGSVIKTENAATIFGALSLFEDRQKPDELLGPLCDLLFTIYRSAPKLGSQARRFSLQFIPHLVYLYLQNYSDKPSYHSVETLLVALYNIEIGEETKKTFKVPSIATSSIYHDANLLSESRIFAMPDTGLDRGPTVASSSKTSAQPQISHINAQNRAKVVSFLFGLFTSQLGSFTKETLDSSCKVNSRLVLRGFDQRKSSYKSHQRNRSYGSEPGPRTGARPPHSRIFLPSAVYLDMLSLAYFAIFNNCGMVGLQLSKDIEFRARHDSYANVIIVSKAVSQLASSSSARIEAPPISTPSVLTKNMITNASFRTKKLECDIPRVECEEDSANLNSDKMGIIAEEVEADVERINKLNLKENTDNPDGADKVKIAEKIKAKMENVRENVRENVKIPIRKKEKDKDKDKDKERGASESSDKEELRIKIDKKEKKHREKRADKNSSVDHDLSSEEFIRMNNLQSETVAIHSPESGNTNIF